MPTPTLFINTSLVKWTPSGGTLVALNRITQAGFSWGIEVINNRSDLDIYDSSAHAVGAKPTVTFSGMNVGVYLQLVTGIGAITWQIGNADDQAGTGSLIYTMNPCMNPLGDYSGAHGAYATGNLSFMGLAADGLTNPVSYSVSSAGSFVGPRAIPPLIAGAPRVNRQGVQFNPPASKKEIAADAPVDAVLMLQNHYAAGKNHFKNRCVAQVEAAKILKVDPDQVSMRYQGSNRIYSPTPHFSIYHSHASDYDGHRLDWHPRDDGIVLGYLTDDARQEEQDAA